MAHFSDNFREKVRSSNDIVDVIGAALPLKRNGSNFVCLCPFHKEKSPSFNVNPGKQIFHCFGCQVGGDVFKFIQMYENISFPEAIERLAERARIPLEFEGPSGNQESRGAKDALLKLHEAICLRWQNCLAQEPTGQNARDYLAKRGVGPDAVKEFRLGAAPEAWDDTVNWAKAKGFDLGLCELAGLVIRKAETGRQYDRFRGRLMIPIRDHQGRVVAFTARQLELTPADDPAREAKYVNSPETPIFTKSNLLFNLDRARSHVGEGHPFVLVEGQLDALRCWSIGLKTAIAPQGTSITEGQLALLRRYHPQVECFFDSDSAGQKAALRFLPMALKAGLEVRFLMLAGAEKLDPDLLFLEKGLAAYAELQKGSLSAMRFVCQPYLPKIKQISAEEKSRIYSSTADIILQSESEVVQRQLLEEVAHILELPTSTAVAFLERRKLFKDNPTFRIQPKRTEITDSQKKGEEAHLLFLCLHHESLLHALASQLPHEWIDPSHTAGSLLDRILAEAAHNGWTGRDNLDQLLETEEEKTLVASLLFEAAADDDLIKIANEGLRSLQRRFLEPRQRQIELEIASKGTDVESDLLSLLKQRAEITRQLLHPPKLSLGS